jgi:hypothetical protein
VADGRINNFADGGQGGWSVNGMSKQEDIPKVQGSLGDDPMPTEDLVMQPLVVNGRIQGSAGEEDLPMVCRSFRYILEQVNDLVMQSSWVASQDYKFTELPGDGDLGREILLKEELTPPPLDCLRDTWLSQQSIKGWVWKIPMGLQHKNKGIC